MANNNTNNDSTNIKKDINFNPDVHKNSKKPSKNTETRKKY